MAAEDGAVTDTVRAVNPVETPLRARHVTSIGSFDSDFHDAR
jgi:hypothetical protein